MADAEVNVDITGDATDLEQAIDESGNSVEQLGQSVGSTDDAFDAMNRNAGRLGENLDRASAASSQLSGGIGDVGGALVGAFGEDSGIGAVGTKMEELAPIIMGVTGVMDLLALANSAVSLSWIKQTASMVGAKVAMVATTAATGVATAAQWAWNIAMTANPIGLIIAAVVALIAVIVLIATKTTWFQTIWQAVWGAIVAYFNFVKDMYIRAWNLMWDIGVKVINWIKGVPGMIGSAFSRLFDIITAPWRAAFNFIARAWNNTIGRLSWTIPSWVPGIGGNSISAPRLPQFHSGGRIPGSPGENVVAMLQAGETVGSRSASDRRETRQTTILRGGNAFWDMVVDEIAATVGRRGGDVEVVLGGRRG